MARIQASVQMAAVATGGTGNGQLQRGGSNDDASSSPRSNDQVVSSSQSLQQSQLQLEESGEVVTEERKKSREGRDNIASAVMQGDGEQPEEGSQQLSPFDEVHLVVTRDTTADDDDGAAPRSPTSGVGHSAVALSSASPPSNSLPAPPSASASPPLTPLTTNNSISGVSGAGGDGGDADRDEGVHVLAISTTTTMTATARAAHNINAAAAMRSPPRRNNVLAETKHPGDAALSDDDLDAVDGSGPDAALEEEWNSDMDTSSDEDEDDGAGGGDASQPKRKHHRAWSVVPRAYFHWRGPIAWTCVAIMVCIIIASIVLQILMSLGIE